MCRPARAPTTLTGGRESAFVPEGRCDSSAGTKCLGSREKIAASQRDDGIRLQISLGLTLTSTVPPGRDSLHGYPGTSCLATIVLSLRDKTTAHRSALLFHPISVSSVKSVVKFLWVHRDSFEAESALSFRVSACKVATAKAYSIAVSLSRPNRPLSPPWPAPMYVLSRRIRF